MLLLQCLCLGLGGINIGVSLQLCGRGMNQGVGDGGKGEYRKGEADKES